MRIYSKSESMPVLADYIRQKLTPEAILEAKRRGYVELEFDPILEDAIGDDYEESIKEIDAELKQLSGGADIDINFLGFDRLFKKLSQLSQSDNGKIVKIRGYVNSGGEIEPMFDEAVFVCRKCNLPTHVPQIDPFKLIPPLECEQPVGRGKCRNIKFDLNTNLSRFRDSRRISVQEMPEDVSGQIPIWKKVIVLKKSLLHKVKVGDLVNVIGVVRVRTKIGEESRFTKFYIEANNIIVKRKELIVAELSKEEIEKIIALSKEPNVYEKLCFNIAYSLNGLELEKEVMLLALVGGVDKNLGDITRRSSIHILLVGDPSVGKSQLLTAVATLAPSGIYSSGTGTSGVGLTAAAIKDDKDWVIAAGIVVLADNGIACIDEIDKMSPEDRVKMHEAMEQQRVTVHKADIHVTLSAKTTIIAAANPLLGRYDANKTIGENIKNLPLTLLSRFDIILVPRDIPNKERDEALAKCIMNEEKGCSTLDRIFFKNYIIYAKSFNPNLTVEAQEEITRFYLEGRQTQSPEDPIQISARQLEALKRLAQAHAKILLKTEAGIDDARAAIRLMTASLSQITKFGTSQSNINLLNNPLDKKTENEVFKDIIKEAGIIDEEDWKNKCISAGMSEVKFKKLVMDYTNKCLISQESFYPKKYRWLG